MTAEQMPRATKQIDAMKVIPADKRKRMRVRTFWGVAFIVLGIAMGLGKIFSGVPMLVSFATAIFGALMASGQEMKHALKLLAFSVADLVSASSGKRPTEEEEAQ